MTAGMPISRAVTAPWDRGPPLSVTKAQAAWKSGVQAGFVVRATSTAPGGNDAKSSDERTMKTGPSAMPGLPARPFSSPAPSPASPGPCSSPSGPSVHLGARFRFAS